MHNHLELYIHFVWATYDRLPLLEVEWWESVYRELQKEAVRLGCNVLAVNGVEDHVHMLVKMPATLTIAESAKQVKGASSLFVNDTVRPNLYFQWQGGYSAFTVSRWDVKKITEYIQRQVEHHSNGTTKLALELPKDKPTN